MGYPGIVGSEGQAPVPARNKNTGRNIVVYMISIAMCACLATIPAPAQVQGPVPNCQARGSNVSGSRITTDRSQAIAIGSLRDPRNSGAQSGNKAPIVDRSTLF